MTISTDTTPRPSRRALLGAAALLAVPTAAAPAGAPPPAPVLVPPPAPNPDAELVRLCGAYLAMTDHYNEHDLDDDDEADVLYQRILAVEGEIEALPPQTMAGVMAKARTCLALAGREPTGGWDAGPASDWARDVVLDLTRLYGSAA